MPIKDDLMLRMLDTIGEVIARVTLGRGGGDAAEAERELARAYQHLTGSSRGLVARLSSDELLAILGAPTGYNRERGYVLGRLLEADAELREAVAGSGGADAPPSTDAAGGAGATGGTGAPGGTGATTTVGAVDPLHARLQALDLFLAARAAGLQEDDLDDRIENQRRALDDVLLPEPSHWRLFEDAVGCARFALAEDLLFDALERFGASAPVARHGRGFYRQLEALDDAALEAGGLPRDEVREGSGAFEASLAAAEGRS